jgi:histone-lysine N-methyltransferase SETMAR
MPDPIQIDEPRREFGTAVGTSRHPAYSPDLVPSDFHLFGQLKNRLGGKRFADDEEVETEVRKWLRQESKDFYAAGFDALLKR